MTLVEIGRLFDTVNPILAIVMLLSLLVFLILGIVAFIKNVRK